MNNTLYKYLLLLILLSQHSSICFADNYAEIGLPVIETYDEFTHKGSTQIWWMIQTGNDLIYSGGNTGINEWDGENWYHYPTPKNTRVRALTSWIDGKIYVGTNNDIGYYSPDDFGRLSYHSLLNSWPDENKDFGETWSVSANSKGVMFLSSKYLLFWDGTEVIKIPNVETGNHRIFGIDESFYFKPNNGQSLYQITFKPEPIVTKTSVTLDQEAIIRQVILNKNKKLAVFTARHGVYEIDSGQIKKVTDELTMGNDVNIYNAIQANDGYYYAVSLYHGLFILNSDYHVVKNYKDKDGLGNSTLLSILEDSQGMIWISGVPSIIKMAPPHKYSRYENSSNAGDSENLQLINGQVLLLGDSIHQLKLNANPLRPAKFDRITAERNRTWGITTFKNKILYAGQGGLFSMEVLPNSGYSKEQNILPALFAKAVAVDEATESVFTTTTEGLFKLNFTEGQWKSQLIPETEDNLHYLAIHNKTIWVGTASEQLYKIENAQFDELKTQVTKFTAKDGLGPNNVIPFITSLGLTFGTNDGLMEYINNGSDQLRFRLDLPDIFHAQNQDVFRFYEDESSRFWFRVGNKQGFMQQNKDKQWEVNENIFKYFNDAGYKGFTKTARNILWVAMANGEVYRINISALESMPPKGRLNIRKISNINNNSEIHGGLGQTPIPALTQENNSIRISFALANNSILNAKEQNTTHYRHKLVGSKIDDYSTWTNESTKDFTSLPGGNYRFELQAKDAWGRISKTAIDFNVLPVWYLTKTAWSIYFVFALFIILVSAWFGQKWRTKKLNQRNLELEHLVTERTAEVAKKSHEIKQQQILKDRFFTNVSHEFRTPLTLAIAPLESVISDHPEMDQEIKQPITTALKNSKKMLDLIGLVLDINRLESGLFPLHIATYDVADLIRTTTNKFLPLAEKNHQTITTVNTENPTLLQCDQDQLERCITNLLSNAIKYSGTGSRIIIAILKENKQIGIQVKDNGNGIDPEFEAKVFDRYTQGVSSELASAPGTGIGLSLVKELIELQNGSIQLINHHHNGCEFILWLPNDMTISNSEKSITNATSSQHKNTSDSKKTEPRVVPKHEKSENKTTILVIDDNHELREFIVSRLSNNYHVIQATNGQEGFDFSVAKMPDLVISDVMMPVMDGITMLKKIRSTEVIRSIPIILLTAKSTKRETVDGIRAGADDYLTKPFDTSELVARVERIIEGRKLIRESIRQELNQEQDQFDEKNSFTAKVNHHIVQNLSKPGFNVEELANCMSMSRITLNRKCQKEFEKSPVQLITEIRLQQALILLNKNTYSVSEVAYGVGYDSLSYFSKVFKKRFGHSPTQVKSSS